MDYIKKTISLEAARTRTQGLMPYYEIGAAYSEHSGSSCHTQAELELVEASGHNGNWGKIVANPCFLSEKGKTYESMLAKYYSMLNSVREGTKLRKVETKDGDVIFVEGLGRLVYSGNCFDAVDEPETLYEYASYDAGEFHSAGEIYRYDGDEEIVSDFIVLIPNYKKFCGIASYFDALDGDYPHIEGVEIGNDENHLKWAEYCQVVDAYIGRINIPSWIYNRHIKAPKTMSCADVDEYIDWLENYQTLSADCCNTRLWEDMGGSDMLDYLNTSAKTRCEEYNDLLSGMTYTVPYVEMPILLTQNFTDVGVLTNVGGVEYDGKLDERERPFGPAFYENKQGVCALTIDQIVMEMDRVIRPTTEEFEAEPSGYTDDSGFTAYPIEVESLLDTLRSPKKYTDDKDNVLPGLFRFYPSSETDSTGKMYRCVKQSEEKFYWLVVSESSTTVPISAGSEEYTVKHTLFYEFSRDTNLSKEAIIDFVNNRGISGDNPDLHFYDGYPPVPSSTFSIKESEPNWENKLEEKRAEMSGDITTVHYLLSPISVAEAKWRMETDNVPNDVHNFINADGLPSETPLYYNKSEIDVTKGKFYRTITTCAAGIRIAETEEVENKHKQPFMEHYYFKVKYDNSSGTPMELPYKVGNTANIHYDALTDRYRGDIIISADTVDDGSGSTYFETKYVIGGYLSYNTGTGRYSYLASGDVYYEKHAYDPSHLDLVPLDGVDAVSAWSEYVDFQADAKEFYSPRYNLYRTGNTANIIEYTSGEIWNEDYSYDAYLTKEDYLTNFSLPPKVDVNVTIDRGGASSFERHYKLAECNTMQDLVNYGNNFFNL